MADLDKILLTAQMAARARLTLQPAFAHHRGHDPIRSVQHTDIALPDGGWIRIFLKRMQGDNLAIPGLNPVGTPVEAGQGKVTHVAQSLILT